MVCPTIFQLKESAFASWLLCGNELVCMTVAMHRTFRLRKSVHPFDLFNSQNLIKHGFHAFSWSDFISLAKMMNWEYKVRNEFINVLKQKKIAGPIWWWHNDDHLSVSVIFRRQLILLMIHFGFDTFVCCVYIQFSCSFLLLALRAKCKILADYKCFKLIFNAAILLGFFFVLSMVIIILNSGQSHF